MQISLRLGEFGWSDLDLWLEDTHHNFSITHIFNSPMKEIARAIFELHHGASESTFTLYEEPGHHVWTMSQVADAQPLLLVEIKPYEGTILEFQVERKFFVESFLVELNKIALQLGYPRFSKNRTPEEFPLASLQDFDSEMPS